MDLRALEREIDESLAKGLIPSMAIGIALDGHVTYTRAFGFADVGEAEPATTATPYSLASVTKPMLGTVLAQMSAAGQLDVDTPINHYLSYAKVRAREGSRRDATVRRLANHTAGLPTHFQFFFEYEDLDWPTLEESISRYGILCRPPGEAFCYSNMGYGILGRMIELAAGKPLSEVMQEQLFEPLGMGDASFGGRGAAKRYDTNGALLPHYGTAHPGASEAWVSIDDLLAFGIASSAWTEMPGLSKGEICAMHEPLGPEPCEQRYGLGWMLSHTAIGERRISHGGSMDGVATHLEVVPERGVVLAVLCNRKTPLVESVAKELARRLDIEPGPSATVRPVTEIPNEAIGTWLGDIDTYEGARTIWLEVRANGRSDIVVDGDDAQLDIAMEGDELTGIADVEIETSDTEGTPHTLHLHLSPRDGYLSGYVTARSQPDYRIGNALSYPARLERER